MEFYRTLAASKVDQDVLEVGVLDCVGHELWVKVRYSTSFGKVFQAFLDRHNLEPSKHRFGFDGRGLLPDDTPGSVGMETGNTIDCMREQLVRPLRQLLALRPTQ